MSRAILRGAQLRRAAAKIGYGCRALPTGVGSSAGASATAAGLGPSRAFAAHAPAEFLQQPFWRATPAQARYGGLAAAVAGSVGLLTLWQLERIEELLLPTLGEQELGSSPKRIEDFYAFQNEDTEVGRGQYGTVSTAVDRATGEVVAVKRVPRENATEANFREEAEAHREAGSHPNVVGLKGIFADDECWYIVMELAEGGELYDRLTTEGVLLKERDVCSVLRETADALAYMHDRGIVHGDIKPENMLLTNPAPAAVGTAGEHVVERDTTTVPGARAVGEEGGEVEGQAGGLGKVLLADFGSSFRVKEGSAEGGKGFTKAYTAAYSAPEVVSNSTAVDQKADVWSLGVIAYVMVKGHHPFDPASEATDEEIMESIVNSEPDWDGLEPQASQLIRQMLARDPADRPSAREVLQNSWLRLPNLKQKL